MTIRNEKTDTTHPNNIVIVKGDMKDLAELQKLAITTFQESHGHSASAEDILSYIDTKFSLENFKTEMENPNNHFHLLYLNEELVAYSKIILNTIYNEQTPNTSAKMERLYVLQKYHGSKVGKVLMDFNIELAQENQQNGIWLFVWTKNHRAIRFYEKYGFFKIADTVFQISKNHGNPNFILYLSL